PTSPLFPTRRSSDLEQADDIITHVQLPPPQPVPGRRREGVVAVVPTLPKRQDPEDKVVAAVISTPIRLAAPEVPGGVHAPGDVRSEEHTSELQSRSD